MSASNEPLCLDQRYRPMVLSGGGRATQPLSEEQSLTFTTKHYELGNVLAGTIAVRKSHENRWHNIRPGTLWLSCPGETWEARQLVGLKWRYLHFVVGPTATQRGETSKGTRYVTSKDTLQPNPESVWGIHVPRYLTHVARDFVDRSFAEILDCYWRGPSGRLRADAELTRLLAEIIAPLMKQEHESTDRELIDGGLVNHAQTIMLQALPRRVSIKEVANRCYVSVEHLNRIFTATVGESIAHWQRGERLSYAASRLRAGGKIAEVSSEVGYQSASAFRSAFTKQFGVTPGRYKAQY